MERPNYTAANCTAAYRLHWNLTVFTHRAIPHESSWRLSLDEALEPHGIRLLDVERLRADSLLLFLSTRPHVDPATIVQRVKGLLQFLLRSECPKLWRRKFCLESTGKASLCTVERYVAGQLSHHPMMDQRVRSRIELVQYENPDVDLSCRSSTHHGLYLYNLHLVLVHQTRLMIVDEVSLQRTRRGILDTALAIEVQLSRAAIIADHQHLTLRGPFSQSPESIALSFLNGLSNAHDGAALHQCGYSVDTFGEFSEHLSLFRRKR